MKNKCIICGKELSHKRQNSKYCSVKCKREAFCRRRKKESLTYLREELKKLRKDKKFYNKYKEYRKIEKKVEQLEIEQKVELNFSIDNMDNISYKKMFSYEGSSKCLNYDDNNINCVMCFENEIYMNKKCRKIPRSENV